MVKKLIIDIQKSYRKILSAKAIMILDQSYFKNWDKRADFLKHNYLNKLANLLNIEKLELEKKIAYSSLNHILL